MVLSTNLLENGPKIVSFFIAFSLRRGLISCQAETSEERGTSTSVVISKGVQGWLSPLFRYAVGLSEMQLPRPIFFAFILIFQGYVYISLTKLNRKVLFCLFYYLVCRF